MTGNPMSLSEGLCSATSRSSTVENCHVAPSQASPDDSLLSPAPFCGLLSSTLVSPLLTRGCSPFMHTVFSLLARAVFCLPHPLCTTTALSIGSGGSRALCRPPAARHCDLVAVPTVFRLSHTRAPVSQEWSRHCARKAYNSHSTARLFSTGTITCAICPCDRLMHVGVHALLAPSVLALAGNFPVFKFPYANLCAPTLCAHLLTQPRNPHSAATEYHCGGIMKPRIAGDAHLKRGL
ncbi:hypothetical protein B0H14DRAFT_3748519 [Mycena olivaceomarginata]|nr:hypothetical protein B0H14DRAFT_3748519 [Mycena olivaceomarginata]